MANDILTDADVGLSGGLSDSDVGLENTQPNPFPKLNLSPYDKYRLEGHENVSGPFGPAHPEEVLALADAAQRPFISLPDTASKGPLAAAYRAIIKPAVEGIESPVGVLMAPLLAESALARVGAGIGFGGMAAHSGLQKMGSEDPQTQLEGRLELAGAPLLALSGGARDKVPSVLKETPRPELNPENLVPKTLEDRPPTVSAVEGQPTTVTQPAPSAGAAESGVTPPVEPAIAENNVNTTEAQHGVIDPSVTTTVTDTISQGPGAASPGDVPAAPRQAIAAAGKIENALPEDRPLGPVSPVSIALNSAHDAIRNIATFVKGIAGESMPKTTAANREVGEAGVRYASSRIAAKPLARTFAAKVLEGTDVDPIKFGAALTEDNLRSIRESLRQKVTEYTAEGKGDLAKRAQEEADNVASIIGSKGSPFKTEDEYFDFLKEPSTQQAIGRHIQMWQEVIDPQYRQAVSIDPDAPLPSRGQQTGARVNLHALFPEDPAAHPIKGQVGSNLTATFKKKSPFAISARGSGQAYDIDYNSIIGNTFERQLEIANKNAFDDKLLAARLAVIDRPGKQVFINDKPAVGFPLSRRMLVATKEGETKSFSQAQNIYVDQSLAREYRSASNVDPKFRVPFVTQVMNVLNRAALSGLTDATVHVSNQLTALFNRPVTGKLFTDTLLSATGRADAPVALIKAVTKAFGDNKAQLSELSKIGAMRAEDIHFGFFGRALQYTDKVTRLVLDDAFKNLVKQGLVENTETARREYVNQIGQYNRRLQGPLTKVLRDTGFGPFVTAGKTFNALGVKMATLSPGAKASNNFAAAALRVNVLSKWVGMATLVGTLNYLLTRKLKNGGVLGRPGTPIGSVDTGTNDKSGKQQSFPLASVLGLGRGLRVTGIGGAINTKRLGLTDADAAQSAARDIINSWTAPAAGPPVKFGMIAASGYPPAVNVGRTSRVVPPGDVQIAENIKEALRQASPLVQTYIKYRQGKSTPEVLSSQIPRFTMTPGKTESMVEKYPKIVSMAQGSAFIDDMIHQARQLPKEERRKFVNEQVQRLPVNQRAHGRQEAVRRKVYTN